MKENRLSSIHFSVCCIVFAVHAILIWECDKGSLSFPAQKLNLVVIRYVPYAFATKHEERMDNI